MVHHVSIAIQTGSSLPVYQGLQLVKYTQQIRFFSRFRDFDDKILYLCAVYLTRINLTAVTL